MIGAMKHFSNKNRRTLRSKAQWQCAFENRPGRKRRLQKIKIGKPMKKSGPKKTVGRATLSDVWPRGAVEK